MFANSISNLYTKRLPQNSYQESVRYTSVTLCAVSTSVTLRYLRSLRDSVCLFYKTFSLSIHIRKNLKNSKTSTQKVRINREKLSFTQSIRTMYFNLNATYTLPVKIRTINKYFPHGNNITYKGKK